MTNYQVIKEVLPQNSTNDDTQTVPTPSPTDPTTAITELLTVLDGYDLLSPNTDPEIRTAAEKFQRSPDLRSQLRNAATLWALLIGQPIPEVLRPGHTAATAVTNTVADIDSQLLNEDDKKLTQVFTEGTDLAVSGGTYWICDENGLWSEVPAANRYPVRAELRRLFLPAIQHFKNEVKARATAINSMLAGKSKDQEKAIRLSPEYLKVATQLSSDVETVKLYETVEACQGKMRSTVDDMLRTLPVLQVEAFNSSGIIIGNEVLDRNTLTYTPISRQDYISGVQVMKFRAAEGVTWADAQHIARWLIHSFGDGSMDEDMSSPAMQAILSLFSYLIFYPEDGCKIWAHFYGVSDAGKSYISDEFIPKLANIAKLAVKDLGPDEARGTTDCAGLANNPTASACTVGAEISAKSRLYSTAIKAITSGLGKVLRRMNRDDFWVPFRGPLITNGQDPSKFDVDDGIMNRLVAVNMTRTITGVNAKFQVPADAWETELPVLFELLRQHALNVHRADPLFASDPIKAMRLTAAMDASKQEMLFASSPCIKATDWLRTIKAPEITGSLDDLTDADRTALYEQASQVSLVAIAPFYELLIEVDRIQRGLDERHAVSRDAVRDALALSRRALWKDTNGKSMKKRISGIQHRSMLVAPLITEEGTTEPWMLSEAAATLKQSNTSPAYRDALADLVSVLAIAVNDIKVSA